MERGGDLSGKSQRSFPPHPVFLPLSFAAKQRLRTRGGRGVRFPIPCRQFPHIPQPNRNWVVLSLAGQRRLVRCGGRSSVWQSNGRLRPFPFAALCLCQKRAVGRGLPLIHWPRVRIAPSTIAPPRAISRARNAASEATQRAASLFVLCVPQVLASCRPHAVETVRLR
jgi:hypothetical protein